MDTSEITSKLRNAKGFMVTVNVLNENGEIQHYLFTEEFPYLDMLTSHAETKKLIINELENAKNLGIV